MHRGAGVHNGGKKEELPQTHMFSLVEVCIDHSCDHWLIFIQLSGLMRSSLVTIALSCLLMRKGSHLITEAVFY